MATRLGLALWTGIVLPRRNNSYILNKNTGVSFFHVNLTYNSTDLGL